jgi:hypothetical protein
LSRKTFKGRLRHCWRGGDDVPVRKRTRLARRHFYQYCCSSRIFSNHHSATDAAYQRMIRLLTLIRRQKQKRPQCLGSRSRSRVSGSSGDSPSRIAGLPPVRRHRRSASPRKSYVLGCIHTAAPGCGPQSENVRPLCTSCGRRRFFVEA